MVWLWFDYELLLISRAGQINLGDVFFLRDKGVSDPQILRIYNLARKSTFTKSMRKPNMTYYSDKHFLFFLLPPYFFREEKKINSGNKKVMTHISETQEI